MAAKLNKEKVEEIRRRYAAGEKAVDLAQEFGVERTSIYRAANGDTWNEEDENKPPKPRTLPMIKTLSLRVGGTLTIVFEADIFTFDTAEQTLLAAINTALQVYEDK